ncbi:HEPN domain-containing protein [Anaerotignum lactatifermentans]
MEIKNTDFNDEIYTGTLQYQGDEYGFVFSNTKLRLIPVSEEKRASMWTFGMKEIQKGTYTWDEPPRMEEDILVGECNESGKQIIFLPKKGEYLSHQNSVLFVDLEAYIICKYVRDSISRVSFNGPEINCIHSTNRAIECIFDVETFMNNGTFSVTTKDFGYTTTPKQPFVVDGKMVSVYFGISRTMSTRIWEPPMTLSSNMMFEFDATNDYRFILKLWYIAKQFIQFLCYRKNIQFSKVELAILCEDGKFESFAELYVLDKKRETELQTLKDGRYIKQVYISGHEGEILSDIANDKLYLRHLPESFQSGQFIDAARFVMITAAFEWEFDRMFPDGIPKSEGRVKAELEVSKKLNELIESSKGKTKGIYKSLLKSIERSPSLANKIEKIGSDIEIIEPFGNQIYNFNKESLNYIDIGKRLADQRNHFAHGDLDKEFIGLSLLDLIFLQRIIYVMQLEIYGVDNQQIQKAINDLFRCRLCFNT